MSCLGSICFTIFCVHSFFSLDLVKRLEGVQTVVSCFEGFLADALNHEVDDIIEMLKSYDRPNHIGCRGAICPHIASYFWDMHEKFERLTFGENGLRDC